jgi:Zn-dependent metalloprotease
MKKVTLFLCSVLLVLAIAFSATSPGFGEQPPPPEKELLLQDSDGETLLTWNPVTHTPSFIQTRVPVSILGQSNRAGPQAIASAFLNRYAGLLGIHQPDQELRLRQITTDALGMQHVSFDQVYAGKPVYAGQVRVHFAGGRSQVLAIDNSFIPAIQLNQTQARLSSQEALAVARQALPEGQLLSDPALFVYSTHSKDQPQSVYLVWMVELYDHAIPARNVYVVDAVQAGIIDVLDRLYEGRNRSTYNANNDYSLPGTLARAEGDDPTGDQDVDQAHDFAGDTYDYYYSTFNRDSYDNAGAALISSAHYGVNYQNAFWNGTQMVYGDGFTVKDVIGHELTHAVTERTANLEYRWQSGALNESISDIFGAMIDRDDWLMGEDLPASVLGGRDAIRDLADPTRFGQPAHVQDWVATCSDNEGVHINSGIPNKAYVNIANAIGKDPAEHIFYRLLTQYLNYSSSLEDARAGALQSASDLFGSGSTEYAAVEAGFMAVGLDGAWNPPSNDCACPVQTAFNLRQDQSSASSLETMVTLYRLRDQVLKNSPAGKHYQDLYVHYSAQISALLVQNGDLRSAGIDILRAATPGLASFLDGNGDQVILTQTDVDNIQLFLLDLAEQDRQSGEGELAGTIETEMARIPWQSLVGLTYDQAWRVIRANLTYQHFLFIPAVLSR